MGIIQFGLLNTAKNLSGKWSTQGKTEIHIQEYNIASEK
jgi:hypothetical protein